MSNEVDLENKVAMVQASLAKLEADPTIKAYEAFKKLSSQPEWKELFDDYLLGSEAVRLVKLRADPAMVGDSKDSINDSITAIGELHMIFSSLHPKYERIMSDIKNANEFLTTSRKG